MTHQNKIKTAGLIVFFCVTVSTLGCAPTPRDGEASAEKSAEPLVSVAAASESKLTRTELRNEITRQLEIKLLRQHEQTPKIPGEREEELTWVVEKNRMVSVKSIRVPAQENLFLVFQRILSSGKVIDTATYTYRRINAGGKVVEDYPTAVEFGHLHAGARLFLSIPEVLHKRADELVSADLYEFTFEFLVDGQQISFQVDVRFEGPLPALTLQKSFPLERVGGNSQIRVLRESVLNPENRRLALWLHYTGVNAREHFQVSTRNFERHQQRTVAQQTFQTVAPFRLGAVYLEAPVQKVLEFTGEKTHDQWRRISLTEGATLAWSWVLQSMGKNCDERIRQENYTRYEGSSMPSEYVNTYVVQAQEFEGSLAREVWITDESVVDALDVQKSGRQLAGIETFSSPGVGAVNALAQSQDQNCHFSR